MLVSEHLEEAVERADVEVDDLAERTKVPQTTILALMDRPVSAILPERCYLRGHLLVLARELDLDIREIGAQFDVENPVEEKPLALTTPGFGTGTTVAVAGACCFAILAIVLAFIR